MKIGLFASAAILFLLASGPAALAQGSASPGASPAPAEDGAKPKRTRKKREGAAKKEMSVGQIAASERRKKCGAEWKEAKAGNKTGGLKWPKFYSQCNARLKGKDV